MITSLPSELLSHLWQSTLIVGIVWLMARVLRGNRARVRYWLWTGASVKFLMPFSWLVSLGAKFEWRMAPAVASPAATFVEQILAPPIVSTVASPATAQSTTLWLWGLALVWVAGFLVVLFWWWRQWGPVHAALREARVIVLDCAQDFPGLAVMSSPWTFEPGVVGIWRPVLLLADGLQDQLTPAQMRAVIVHEHCHIHSRDNLTAAVHMLVEAVFWFHPLVWWIGSRLVDERERACDEAVLRAGNDPADYVEGILTVCRFTLSAPIACVAGVSGAELRKRIESIVRMEIGTRLPVTRSIALALVVGVVIGMPIVSGLLKTDVPVLAAGQAPKPPVVFEVAAVRQNNSGQTGFSTEDDLPGGRYRATNAPLRLLIRQAYGISEMQLVDAPSWTQNERFDINATLEREPPFVPFGVLGERQFALQSLLATRFKLVVHRETREVPLYALVLAQADRKPGAMLKPSSADCSPAAMAAHIAAGQAGKTLACGTLVNTTRIQFGGRTMSDFAGILSSIPFVGRGVVDRTGLTGNWQFELTYTPAPDQVTPARSGQEPPRVDLDGPSFFTALQDQLGLKLESIRGPMEFLVVDGVETLREQ